MPIETLCSLMFAGLVEWLGVDGAFGWDWCLFDAVVYAGLVCLFAGWYLVWYVVLCFVCLSVFGICLFLLLFVCLIFRLLIIVLDDV